MSIIEINSIGTFDLVSNKYFKYYNDTINSSKIYFEPLNNNFFEVLYDELFSGKSIDDAFKKTQKNMKLNHYLRFPNIQIPLGTYIT
jgi:hypothetical protein